MEIPEIKNKSIQNNIKVANKAPVTRGGSDSSSASGSAQGSDKTAFSAEAIAIQKAITTVKEGPNLSQAEKVAKLKQDYQNGQLEVDTHKVAEKMLKDIITESLSLGS